MSIGHTHPGFRTVHTNTKKAKTQKHNQTKSIDKPHTPWVLSMVINTNTHTHKYKNTHKKHAHRCRHTHISTDTYGDTLHKKSQEASREAIRYAAALQAWDSDPTI